MAATNRSLTEAVTTISASLSKEAQQPDPSAERILDVLKSLQRETSDGAGASETKMTVAVLERTRVGKAVTKSAKSFKRHRRTADDGTKATWNEAIAVAERLASTWKAAAEAEYAAQSRTKKASAASAASKPGLPSSSAAYKARLISQKKDMYKDPPSMPPAKVEVEKKWRSLPKRNKKSGEHTFPPGEDEEVNKMLQDFRPNRTPEEVLRAGSFGGTYFRPIVSAVTNLRYNASDVLNDTVEPSWIKGLNKAATLTSTTYRNSTNKYGVKCGGSLGMWESSGWITDSDPYGWFQWYCRFYRGRRCSDDARQISRWLKSAGPKGRFRSQLCNKCLAANTTAGDRKISPVIRQTLLHWGLEVTEDVLEKHRKRVGA